MRSNILAIENQKDKIIGVIKIKNDKNKTKLKQNSSRNNMDFPSMNGNNELEYQKGKKWTIFLENK